MQSLNLKYRPKTFEDVCGQQLTTTILKKVVETRQFKNCYLFAGKSGCGKTTCARIFANEINRGEGSPIEIDAASNNGVDAVREIIDGANQRSIYGEYKIYIIDEAHAITTAGWQAFLKGIEEPPAYTVFIFCTTEPNKIPVTILNRMQRYNFSAISSSDIKNRLMYICQNEGFTNYSDACEFISKISIGGMRDAITYLDKVSDYSHDLNLNNVLTILGDFSADTFMDICCALLRRDEGEVIRLIEKAYTDGRDMRMFINSFLNFSIDIVKYNLFKKIELTHIPAYLEGDVRMVSCVGTDNEKASLQWFNKLADKLLVIKNDIKNDSDYLSTIEVHLINVCRGIL